MKTSSQESFSAQQDFSRKVLPVLFPTTKPTRTKSICVNFQRNLSGLPKVYYQKAQEILNICQYNDKKKPLQTSFIPNNHTQASIQSDKDSVLGLTKDNIHMSPERKRSYESRLIDDEQKKVLYIKLKKTLDGKFVNKSSGPTFNDHVSNKIEILNKIRVISNASELKTIKKSPIRHRGSLFEERTPETKENNEETSPRSFLNDCTLTTIELDSIDFTDDRALDLTMGSSSNRETSIDKSLTQRDASPVKKVERTSFPLIRSSSDKNLRKINFKKPIYAGYNLQVVGNQKSICLSSRPNFRENKSANTFGALDRSSSIKCHKNSMNIGSGNISFVSRSQKTRETKN